LAVGQIGISPTEYWDLTLKELSLIIEGYGQRIRNERYILFELFRFNAQATAFSKEQAQSIKKAKNPFKDKNQQDRGMTYDQIIGTIKTLEGLNVTAKD